MQFTLTVDMSNAAFDDPDELPRILRDIAQRIHTQASYGGSLINRAPVRDTNGNTVGKWEVTS